MFKYIYHANHYWHYRKRKELNPLRFVKLLFLYLNRIQKLIPQLVIGI